MEYTKVSYGDFWMTYWPFILKNAAKIAVANNPTEKFRDITSCHEFNGERFVQAALFTYSGELYFENYEIIEQ